MRKFILPLLASLAVATPALADTRAEVRGGAIWSNGASEATYGAAIGFDGDLGPAAFYGLELSGDKIDATGTKVAFGLSGRAGLKAGPSTRVYGTGGYTTEACDLCDGQWHAGAGLEQNVAPKIYIKAEYRHYFETNSSFGADALVGGVGLRF
jgi:opacity protein-like surface antigen